jgi:O-methyltransferase
MTIKAILGHIANKFGFEITQISKLLTTQAYEKVMPAATYSPWNKDGLFNEAYAAIQPYTLVDKYRCFELWSLIAQIAKLQSGSIIEIGVWRGGTGALIAKQAKNCGIEGQIYLCDTFSGVVKAGPKDSVYKGGEHSDATRQVVEKLIFDQMKLDNVKILEGIFPDQTGYELEHMQFRFCHIDVDVYQSAKDVVDWIWDRMVSGGIVVYDDYGTQGCDGITKYVEEQIYTKDRIVIHNLNGHAVIIKL